MQPQNSFLPRLRRVLPWIPPQLELVVHPIIVYLKQVTQNKGEKSGETCVPEAYKTWLSLQLLVKFGNITQTNRGKQQE